jgi:hypothetical protein
MMLEPNIEGRGAAPLCRGIEITSLISRPPSQVGTGPRRCNGGDNLRDVGACLSAIVSVANLTKTSELIVLGEAIVPDHALRPQSTTSRHLPRRPGSPPSRGSHSKQSHPVHIVDGSSNKLIAREAGDEFL